MRGFDNDMTVIALFATLALLVLVIERCKSRGVPPSLQPPAPGKFLAHQLNVPRYRNSESVVLTAADLDGIDAEEGEFS